MAGKERKGNKISRAMVEGREESQHEEETKSRMSQRWEDEEQEGKSNQEVLNGISNDCSPLSQEWLLPNPVDEIPIMKRGPSSFEELLERELAKDSSSTDTIKSAPNSGTRTSFLKRGTRSISSFSSLMIFQEVV